MLFTPATQPDLAGVWALEAGDDAQQCRLAAAGGAEDRRELAGLSRQIHPGESLHDSAAHGERLLDAGHGEHAVTLAGVTQRELNGASCSGYRALCRANVL